MRASERWEEGKHLRCDIGAARGESLRGASRKLRGQRGETARGHHPGRVNRKMWIKCFFITHRSVIIFVLKIPTNQQPGKLQIRESRLAAQEVRFTLQKRMLRRPAYSAQLVTHATTASRSIGKLSGNFQSTTSRTTRRSHGNMSVIAQTSVMTQGSLRGTPVLGRSSHSKFGRSPSSSSRVVNRLTRASLHSQGVTSERDPYLMSTIRAGGMVVPRQEAGDPFGLLLRERIVFLGNQVDDFTADAVISQLLLLDAQDPKKVRACSILSPFHFTRSRRSGPGSRTLYSLKKNFAHLNSTRFRATLFCRIHAGHQALHQLSWWICDSGHGNL